VIAIGALIGGLAGWAVLIAAASYLMIVGQLRGLLACPPSSPLLTLESGGYRAPTLMRRIDELFRRRPFSRLAADEGGASGESYRPSISATR
jgi:hypothetical protein